MEAKLIAITLQGNKHDNTSVRKGTPSSSQPPSGPGTCDRNRFQDPGGTQTDKSSKRFHPKKSRIPKINESELLVVGGFSPTHFKKNNAHQIASWNPKFSGWTFHKYWGCHHPENHCLIQVIVCETQTWHHKAKTCLACRLVDGMKCPLSTGMVNNNGRNINTWGWWTKCCLHMFIPYIESFTKRHMNMSIMQHPVTVYFNDWNDNLALLERWQTLLTPECSRNQQRPWGVKLQVGAFIFWREDSQEKNI